MNREPQPENKIGEPDGLYQVTKPYLCAGYVIRNNRVIMCAPILRKKLTYWRTIGRKVG